MEKNLRAFMKEDLKNRGTMEFEGIEKYTDENGKPIPFIIKRLSRREIAKIRNAYRKTEVYRDKNNGNRPIIGNNGQVAVIKDYDSEKAGLHLMVDAFVQPKLDDPDLMKYYDVDNRLDMPNVIFSDAKDFSYADECLSIALGLKQPESERETVDEIKD